MRKLGLSHLATDEVNRWYIKVLAFCFPGLQPANWLRARSHPGIVVAGTLASGSPS